MSSESVRDISQNNVLKMIDGIETVVHPLIPEKWTETLPR